MKTNNWLLAGCLPLLICLTVFIKCDKIVVESEVNENHHSAVFKLDSLIIINNELKSELVKKRITMDKIDNELEKMGMTMEMIDNELEMNIVPIITINNDNRKACQEIIKSLYNNKTDKNNEIKIEESVITIPRDTFSCSYPNDFIQ